MLGSVAGHATAAPPVTLRKKVLAVASIDSFFHGFKRASPVTELNDFQDHYFQLEHDNVLTRSYAMLVKSSSSWRKIVIQKSNFNASRLLDTLGSAHRLAPAASHFLQLRKQTRLTVVSSLAPKHPYDPSTLHRRN